MNKKNDKIIVQRFSEQMLIELNHNERKGSVLDWDNFDNMITELEYHKAKMFIAFRNNNLEAAKEYIADQANILMAIGNKFKLYDSDSIDNKTCHELIIPSIVKINNDEAKTIKHIING